MNKLIAFTLTALTALTALVTTNARAGEDLVVLTDTRQYDGFTSSFGGLKGCTMPADPDKPRPGDCQVTRARYTKSGELLVRNVQRNVCERTVWQQLARKPLTYQGHDVSAPDLAEQSESYACQADGTPLKRP